MADASEFEDIVETMMGNNEIKKCLEYIETEIDADVVLDNPFLFESKLNCLYELDRKMDAFMEAKAYRADYRALSLIVCTVLGNGYEKEGNYNEAYFYFSQYSFDGQDDTLSRLLKEIEKEATRKFDEEKYEECLEYIKAIEQNAVLCSEDIFDLKLKCFSKLNRNKEAFKEANAHLESGSVLSHYGYEILGSSYASKGNYEEAYQNYKEAMERCGTKEEKHKYRNLINSLKREEEARKMKEEDKRVAKIDPNFLKDGNKNEKKSTEKTKAKKERSQLQWKDYDGDSVIEEGIKSIVLEKKSSFESNNKKEVEKTKEIGVANLQFSSSVKFSVVELGNDVIDVTKEDIFHQSSMSLIKASHKHLSYIKLLTTWGYKLPYMARVESVLPSNSISTDPLLVVERIQPLNSVFTSKRNDFLKNTDSSIGDWWDFIGESFRVIFRDIICGLFFLHHSNRVCSDFNDSLYVNNEGRGKILHNFSEPFSFEQAKQDVKDLVKLVEVVITGPTCRLDDKNDWTSYFTELKDAYNLPEELYHFLVLLNSHHDKIALCKLPSHWLMDHPFFWDDGHRINFVKKLKDLTREGLLSETAFDRWIFVNKGGSWFKEINNSLLLAIYKYKRSSYQSTSSIVFYMNAVYSHINDKRYKKIRGDKKLSDFEIEKLLRSTFPTVYTFLFEVLCILSVENPKLYSEVFNRLSSCCVLKIDQMCLKESR